MTLVRCVAALVALALPACFDSREAEPATQYQINCYSGGQSIYDDTVRLRPVFDDGALRVRLLDGDDNWVAGDCTVRRQRTREPIKR